VHAPGTVMNDQFGGQDPWKDYFSAVNAASPPIEAIGVTDYYLTDAYTKVVAAKLEGVIPNVKLIFPNVELRLNVGTVRGRWVNIHLLVCPNQNDHVEELHRFLARLRFQAHGDTYSCTRDDLIKLGKAADPNILDDKIALSHGAGQFKVDFNQLRDEFAKSDWAKENVLVAIAGAETDGTSGVRDAADSTLRQEMEKFGHIIFASSTAQREFWLGYRSVNKAQLCERYGGTKPCLHGSDGHTVTKVGVPDDNRFSWIKGAVEFDALRQACIDPESRAYVGEMPPAVGAPSQVIDYIDIENAPWAGTTKIEFNSGLVAIIGARGSGKTALADMVAVACDAACNSMGGPISSSSFIERARDLLGESKVTIAWKNGNKVQRFLNGSSVVDSPIPRVRYLSQQFVEDLCSSSGVSDALLREIERVIFESHPTAECNGALTFDELLDSMASRFRQARTNEESSIAIISERIGDELEKIRILGDLAQQVQNKKKTIGDYTADQSKLIPKGQEERAKKLSEVTAAAEKVRGYVRYFNAQEQSATALSDAVSHLRRNQAPEMLRVTQQTYSACNMKPEEWKTFLIDYTGNVDAQIESLLVSSRKAVQAWKGIAPVSPQTPDGSFLPTGTPLEQIALAVLDAESNRLQGLVNADVVSQRQFAALSKKIASETDALRAMEERLKDAEGAKERVKSLQVERDRAYAGVFEAIAGLESTLNIIYEPLKKRLAASSGTLNKLSFVVSRKANIEGWAAIAENELLDLRRQGPFRGKGSLLAVAEQYLRGVWESGDVSAISAAMTMFRQKFHGDLLEHAAVPKANPVEYRAWLKRLAKWLYSTDHIQLHYSVQYDGIDIRKLSPGTRGVVLLLLYLAIDDADDRPLIIDQPEENLDPKSVFDELVGLFTSAKTKRQVIIVTHNANLVINTDADQIIIANAERQIRGALPRLSYQSGGLESKGIRKSVCDILEGGAEAFKERARRLRVNLSR